MKTPVVLFTYIGRTIAVAPAWGPGAMDGLNVGDTVAVGDRRYRIGQSKARNQVTTLTLEAGRYAR